MRIRRATSNDAGDVRRIIDYVYVGEGWADPVATPAYVEQLLDAESRIGRADVFVADLKQTPIATVTAATQGSGLTNVATAEELEVRMLAVLPEARGHGAATALMRACEDLGRESGLRRIVLSTEERMAGAQALYAALGYRRDPARDWQFAETRLLVYTHDL